MTNHNLPKVFDLRERLMRFSINVLSICRFLPQIHEGDVIRRQLARSGTAIGANFEEADGALTKKDFINKVAIARKEAKETIYWLKLAKNTFSLNDYIDLQINETDEVIRILSTILKKSGYKFRM
ncbi:hypothetical protein A2311_04560 [candidate division WOR-1 bacterium RIFOXYB2_FULL_48_7]|uniref:Four helix bundle protein n=1 Tax=candidate division WOR-1 bacterium RIFOXYB2_FULL_48_7 TaxID=1802583 RepID=A0A1F4TTX1_UNCSA|nr:MAG: hypothetical protein A2311_04560 [candidate division WOR-1 bacterium RIFOXYB2_FULL_48_7]